MDEIEKFKSFANFFVNFLLALFQDQQLDVLKCFSYIILNIPSIYDENGWKM